MTICSTIITISLVCWFQDKFDPGITEESLVISLHDRAKVNGSGKLLLLFEDCDIQSSHETR